MKPVVFLGPTLSREEAERELDALYLPPAVQGDVYRAALEKPPAILLIDGCFEQAPAVAHKEILWALSQGIHVYGASSMGALRAAELDLFGMVGVGSIFESYRDGLLDRDDEVAVSHTSAEHAYRRLSEALVDIRATLNSAVAKGILTADDAARVKSEASALFYPDRCWPLILAAAARAGVRESALTALKSFVRDQPVSQKRLDALLALRTLKQALSAPLPPKRTDHLFEHTDAWEHIACEAARKPSITGETDPEQACLDSLSSADDLAPLMEGALLRALALDWAAHRNRTIEGQSFESAVDTFRRERDLYHPDDVRRWLHENQVKDPTRFWQDEAHVQFVRTHLWPAARRCLPDHLRSIGRYPGATRAAG
ncbi:MAG: TfuA-like protein [Polyangiaceae bacterium]